MTAAPIEIRPMTPGDLPAGLALSSAAGWNQTLDDWRLSYALGADRSFVATSRREVVGTVIGVSHGSAAWIGMMLVREDVRRRGIGKRLMRQVMAACAGHRYIGLDATPAGRPLYLLLGFHETNKLERRVRPAAPFEYARDPRVVGIRDPEAVCRMDERATGIERSALIHRLVVQGDVGSFALEVGGSQSGFCLTRPGQRYRYIGPLAAHSVDDAGVLLRAVLAAFPGQPLALDVPVRQPAWRSLLEALGFSVTRRLDRMVYGEEFEWDEAWTTALAGPEWG